MTRELAAAVSTGLAIAAVLLLLGSLYWLGHPCAFRLQATASEHCE